MKKKRFNLDIKKWKGKKQKHEEKKIREKELGLNTYSSVATSMMPVWSGDDGLRLLGINIPTKYGSSHRRASLPVNRKRLLYSIAPW